MKQNDCKVQFLVQAAIIAALYVALAQIFAPVSFGAVQLRVAEALTILPYFTAAAVPGLFVGCLIGNILGGAILPDIIFGSLATLLGAVLSRYLRHHRFLVPLPPIAANTVIVPLVLRYGYGVTIPLPLQMLTVGLGEVAGCGLLGLCLLLALEPHRTRIFGTGCA